MKVREKLKYISNRVLILMGAAWILLLFTALAQVVEAVRSGGGLWPAGVTAALALAFLPVGWFWVIVPYLKSEKMVQHFMEGYIFSENGDLGTAILTPSLHQQMKSVEKLLRSPQRIDLNKRQAQYLALQNQIGARL